MKLEEGRARTNR